MLRCIYRIVMQGAPNVRRSKAAAVNPLLQATLPSRAREIEKMPSTSSKKNGHKLKKKHAAKAKTARSPQRRTRASPLNAQRDAARIQDLQRKPRKTHSELGLDVVELVNRRAKAFLEFPMRVVSCRSPFELWSTQARFAHAFFSDYQSAAQHILMHALHGICHAEAHRAYRSTLQNDPIALTGSRGIQKGNC